MSALNLVLHPGCIYCRECLRQIPATFLFCPCCYGFVRDGHAWVTPLLSAPRLPEPEEQQNLLFPPAPEHPA